MLETIIAHEAELFWLLPTLYDTCAECKAHLKKSDMITLLARSKRGEQPKQFGFMCKDCFKQFCKKLGLDIPELAELAESITIGSGDDYG